MRFIRQIRARLGRYLILFLTILIFLFLLAIDGESAFIALPDNISLLTTAAGYGFSALVAVVFFAVGTIIWLFARDRRVAFLLFCFCFTMMMAFTLQTGTLSGNIILTIFSNVGATLSLILFVFLLLLFPKNYFAQLIEQNIQNRASFRPAWIFQFKLLYGYLLVVCILCLFSLVTIPLYYLYKPLFRNWIIVISYLYFLIVLSGIITIIINSYRRITSERQRQQLRFFTIGVVVAFFPLLALTVFPELLSFIGFPKQYIVSSQISTAPIILLPAAIGYSILRYQLLVFDMYIRRAVSWMVGVVFLAIVGYNISILGELFLGSYAAIHTGVVVAALVIMAPFAWWMAHVTTEKLFFKEIQHYRRLIEKPNALLRETMNISEIAELLMLAAVETFETQEVCLFVYDRDSGCFQVEPAIQNDRTGDDARARLARRLIDAQEPSREGKLRLPVPALQSANWLNAGNQLLQNVKNSRRPLFLSEAVKPTDQQPTGLALYLATELIEDDPLLVAVRVQGRMIGLLALGERGDHQQWAGPDFEVIDLLLTRYSPMLENARLYEQASRHAAILNALYSSSATLEKNYASIDEVVVAYAAVAAGAAKADAEAWLLSAGAQGGGDGEAAQKLWLACHIGHGASLHVQNSPSEGDWQGWFYEGSSPDAWTGPSAHVPACLSETPCYPFAWLPLGKGEEQYGFLALTYARPHLFSVEEKRLWDMFADQCSAAIENALANIALRAAYERQKELDILKDQFIMTASHELRTPLTAVQGYIDLLQSYGDRLTPEARADFIAKAGRGCDELTLMVNNIMDASRVQEEAEQIQLHQLPLLESVKQVLEMMDAVAKRENRQMSIDDASNVLVMGDEQRLKQIILNLLGNAFKYSPQGSPLEISVRVEEEQGMLRIRDYGLGVPPEEQQRLFDRFMRLERDMNSPARGAGLGLSICKQLTEAMGGHIWVESTGVEGEGSTFVVALKLYHPAQVPVQ